MEPAFATVRRVLRACGFDLSMALVPFDPDAPQVARLTELSRLTPKERLDAALVRGGFEQMGYPLDPYVDPEELDEQRRRLHPHRRAGPGPSGGRRDPRRSGPRVPKGRPLCDRRRHCGRRDAGAGGRWRATGDAWVYLSAGGALIKALEMPEGTKGHRDLRRRAERVHLGGGLRPWVAAPGDLVRMMEALGRAEQAERLEAMRRVVELDRGSRSANPDDRARDTHPRSLCTPPAALRVEATFLTGPSPRAESGQARSRRTG